MDNHEGSTASHWMAGLLPVFCLGVLIWISENNSGPNQLRAGYFEDVPMGMGMKPFIEGPGEAAQQEDVEPSMFIYQKTLTAKVTGYTPGVESCGEFADGLTSIGQNAWSLDGVAADPEVLPYGTIIFIPGVGYREVDDTGAAMRDAWRKDKLIHIDLRFAEVSSARKWGVRQLPIHIFIPE